MFLLIVVSFEALMLNLDFGWKRLEYALKAATIGNPGTPNGRGLFPKWICKLDLHFTVPIIPFLMAINLIVEDARSPYGDYPMSLLAWGWGLLGLLCLILPMTFRKTAPSGIDPLPTTDDDNDGVVLDEDDIDTSNNNKHTSITIEVTSA